MRSSSSPSSARWSAPLSARWSPLALAALALAAGCARFGALPAPAPATAAEVALFRDLERQVTFAAAAGWGVDRLEVEGLLEPALDSVCRVPAEARASLAALLDERVAAAGGPVAQAWRARGRDLGAVADLLVLTRMRLLLQRASEAAPGDCPFWLEGSPGFGGRQISHGRWQLTAGGGGKGIVSVRDGELDLLAGGAGRILLGRVDQRGRGLYLGGELGVSASFPKDAQGERSKLLVAADLVVPAVVRLTGVNSYLELEAGWLGRATEDDWGDVDHGVHLGVSVGGRALRTRFFFPGAAFGLSIERLVTGEPVTMLKLGVRIAFDVDL